jgi:hypothetical protein
MNSTDIDYRDSNETENFDPWLEVAKLDQVLKCWLPYNEETQQVCRAEGNFARSVLLYHLHRRGRRSRQMLSDYTVFFVLSRVGRVVSGLLRDLEIRYQFISDLTNGTEFFDVLSTDVSMIKNFSQVFNTTGNIFELLMEAGLPEDSVDVLRNGYVNLNRLISFDFETTGEMFENKMEVERLFKFKNVDDVKRVGLALARADKPRVARILNEAVDIQGVENTVIIFFI